MKTRVDVWIEVSQKQALTAIGLKAGLSVSELIRRLIAEKLEAHARGAA